MRVQLMEILGTDADSECNSALGQEMLSTVAPPAEVYWGRICREGHSYEWETTDPV